MNKQELIKVATDKGYAIQQSPDGATIGINKGKSVWHWFKFYSDADDAYAFFDHTYSMNTGKSKHGVIHGLKVMESLNAKVN